MIIGRYYIHVETEALYTLTYTDDATDFVIRTLALIDESGEPFAGSVEVHSELGTVTPIEKHILTNGEEFSLSDYEPDY